ncbi:MAG: FtsX-like permease family protein [Gammaproteobacteria bacterium]|nr:FtsX-like permease family protein [Gammaproteobacteria bacterium]
MPALRYALRTLSRDWKSGEIGVLLMALLVAVGSLTAIAFFTDRVGQAVARQATEVLAADLRLRSAEPTNPRYLAEAETRGLATARVLAFPSVVSHGDDSQLGALRAVTEGYPLRGALRIADDLFTPSYTAEGVPARGEVWAESGLLARLGLEVGAPLQVGALELTITRVLEYRPDQAVGFVALAPTILMNLEDIPDSGLVVTGSRVTWSALFAGPDAEIARFAAWLSEQLEEGERLQDIGDAGEQVTGAIDRAQRFLTLASLVSVLLAAVAVAMAARRHAARQVDSVALMKCLGASQRFVLNVGLWQLTLLAVFAGVVGSAIGWVAQFGIAWLLAELVGGSLPAAGPLPALMGLVTSLAVLTGFALPPILQLRSVAPVRVLRRDLPPPRVTASVAAGAAIAVVVLMLAWVLRDLRLLGVVVGGIAGLLAVLMLAGWVLVRLTGRIRGGAGVAWRYGLANINRRGGESITQVVAFGLGLMVLLLLTVVRNDLLDGWRASLPEDAPNNFIINIQPEELPEVQALFAEEGVTPPVFSPLVRARITHLNGVPVREAEISDPDARGLLTREANLSYSPVLPASNTLVDGRFWAPDSRGDEISIEEDIAASLGLSLGDTLGFTVAGEPLVGRITSTRAVAWDSFDPNFFVLFQPGEIEEFPTTFITSIFVPRDERGVLLELVRRHPSVSVIDLESLITQVRQVMDRASLAVQYVFGFTLLAGVVVLLAAVQATRDERRYESALLRTFGARRSLVLRGVIAEFVVLGLLAGVLAAAGAVVVGQVLAQQVFRLAYAPDPLVLVGGPLLGALLVGLAGTLATRSVVQTPPVRTLRA